MNWPLDKDEQRRQTALHMALNHLPKNTVAKRVMELAVSFELYLFDGSLPEPEGPILDPED